MTDRPPTAEHAAHTIRVVLSGAMLEDEALAALDALLAELDMWKRTCLHYQSLLGDRGLL